MEEVMRAIATIVAAIAMSLAGAPVFAQDNADRYTLEKTDNGYVRMDRRTGEMSLCEERSGQLVCKLAADERAAFQADTERLEAAIQALEERVAKLESGLTAKLDQALPTEEEFEKTMGYMERFLRRFMGIAKDLEEEPAKPETPPADPQKT
jgi:flagellar motility protein MotE (MotC chaperone)